MPTRVRVANARHPSMPFTGKPWSAESGHTDELNERLVSGSARGGLNVHNWVTNHDRKEGGLATLLDASVSWRPAHGLFRAARELCAQYQTYRTGQPVLGSAPSFTFRWHAGV